MPFPPEPLRSPTVDIVRRELDRADREEGRRGVILSTLDALGIGFDSSWTAVGYRSGGRGHPGRELAGERGQRQRAVAEDLVVELAQVEGARRRGP